jgi:hypothetical protein
MKPITKPDILDLSAEDYAADPCPTPSLSSSIARILLAQSPRHAWWAHPRLNPAYRREESEAFDLGTAAHAYILQGSRAFAVIDAKDYRTKAAQEARDAAYAEGKTPILAYRLDNVRAMEEAVVAQLAHLKDPPIPFQNGRAEETLVWLEGDVWCRARLDYLHADHRSISDLKTTSASANPAAWERTMFAAGLDVQAAFYLRGLRAVFGHEGTFRFVPVENYEPYALSVVGLAPDALDLADRKVDRAIALWRECLTTGTWPAYPTRTCWAEAPAWEVAKWEQRAYTERDPVQLDDGSPLESQLFGKE